VDWWCQFANTATTMLRRHATWLFLLGLLKTFNVDLEIRKNDHNDKLKMADTAFCVRHFLGENQ